MGHTFYKYQGTGNDFIMVDNREGTFPKTTEQFVARLCDRRFGIGADGLILLEHDPDTDFRMIYFNSDGNQSSMCGNGGRCIVAFAKFLGIIADSTTFMAIDGLHSATIENDMVDLKMGDVDQIKAKPNAFFLDTGSPHHVQIVEGLKTFEVAKEGAKLRYGLYGEKGSNINFVEQRQNNEFAVRTYERGVEGETLSCGTGVTAVAIAMHKAGKVTDSEVMINTLGGELTISFNAVNGAYNDIRLIGPAVQVFKGTIQW